MIDQFRDQALSALEFARRAFDAVDSLHEGEFRARDQSVKDLVEEILPIATFAKAYEAPERRIMVEYKGGGHPYDALIRVSGATVEHGFVPPQYFLEVTTAVSPYEYLEREALRRYGFVFGGGDIWRDPDSREIISRAVVRDPTRAVHELSDRVTTCITKKAQKEYPRPCLLLVFVQPEHRLHLSDWIYLIERNAPLAHQSRFDAVFLVETTSSDCYLVSA